MRDYPDNSIQDFLENESFKNWILKVDENADEYWTQYLKQNPEKREAMMSAKWLLLEMANKQVLFTHEAQKKIWNDLEEKMMKKCSEPGILYKKKVHKITTFYWRRLAATVSIILFLSGVLFWYQSISDSMSFNTPYGKTKSLLLPDGSVVELNANSELSFFEDWKKVDKREVWLDGEAFFNVTHTKTHQQFLVHVGKVTVEVLGTEFNVNNRRAKTTVVLNSGNIKLKIDDKKHELQMKPGDLVEYVETNDKITKKSVRADLYSSWKDDVYNFRATSLAEIANLVKDLYGYDIIFDDPEIATYEFTANVPAGNVKDILILIKETFNVKMKVEDKKVIITK